MCVTLFCSQPHTDPRIKFILGFNREEHSMRPTLPLGKFSEDPNIIGGRDIKSGGTWLGVNVATGLLVFLTNYSMVLSIKRRRKSRGQLVRRLLSTNFLTPGMSEPEVDHLIEEELKIIASEGNEYTPFNLTVYNLRSCHGFYVCSEWPSESNSIPLKHNTPHAFCNSDILSLQERAIHGASLFQGLLRDSSRFSFQEIFSDLKAIFQDRQILSQVPSEASIFLEPYWCTVDSAEWMTMSTSLMMVVQIQGELQVQLREITYHRKDGSETEVSIALNF